MGGSLTGPGGIGGKTGTGAVGNGILGYMFDPANISGMFGKNAGPGAFMDPNGTGGAVLPGVSLGSMGINANPMSLLGGGTAGTASPSSPRPPMSMQNMGQQVATPQARPAPSLPGQQKPNPQMLQQFLQMLGGHA